MQDGHQKLIYFSKSERRAIIIMTLFILIFRILQVFDLRSRSMIEHDYESFIAVIDSLEKVKVGIRDSEARDMMPHVRQIDVNRVTAIYLESLGLKRNVAERWVKFRESIGGFETIDDIAKIYGIPKEWLHHFEGAFVFGINRKKDLSPAKKMAIKPEAHLFSFDPNTVTASQLEILGFTPRTQEALLKFREKGGFFRSVSDLEFLYGMTPEFLKQISEYIIIAVSSEEEVTKDIPPTALIETSIDINESAAEDWQGLKGIGPYYSKRILNFRKHLGGFISVDQVADTYGLPDSVFHKIRPYLKMEKSHDKININKISKSELMEHPYFSHKQASVLINYRDEHGHFHSTSDLYDVKIFDSLFLARVEPYLTFQ